MHYPVPLKPCPFCGSKQISRGATTQSTLYFIECEDCGCGSEHFIDDDIHNTAETALAEAVKSWNKRVHD